MFLEEERKLILKMIDEGKISAEDGVKLLEALNDPTDTGDRSQKQAGQSSETTTTTSLSTKVNWEEGNKQWDKWNETRSEREKKPDFASMFTEFIDSAFQKIKEFDLDFNFGPYEEIHHIFQHKNLQEKRIDVALENGSIDVKPWKENDVKIECQVKMYRGNSSEEARREFLKETVFETDDNELRFYTKTKAMKMKATMYVPEKSYDRLHMYTFNGHLTLDDVHAEKVLGKAMNGSVTFNNLEADTVEGETVNGAITIQNGAYDTVYLKTISGSIHFNAKVEDVEAESVNGTINSTFSLEEDGKAKLSTVTGSIIANVPPHIKTEGYLSTSVGNIHYHVNELHILEEKKDFMQKSLKFVSQVDGSPRLLLDASSKTGSLTVKEKDREGSF